MQFVYKVFFLIFTSFLFCINSFAQGDRPSVAVQPSWVSQIKADDVNTTLDREAEDGYIDVDYEKQVLLSSQCEYNRRVMRVISEAGVQNCSQISVNFDPSYQHLIFHKITITRNGTVINKLNLSEFKVIQKEKDLDDFIYDGSKDAILILDDVRRGDVIDYSYSLVGFNPNFKGEYSGWFSFGYSVPVYNIYYKLIIPSTRSVDIKNFNDTITPIISKTAVTILYEWNKKNIMPLRVQDNLPSWYNPYPMVMISEFKSWKEVNDWAIKLFAKNISLSPELQKKVHEIDTPHKDDESKVLEALHFVQDDIRYMGIEMGEHSHKPASPNKVFSQRFGDCKEKSYLLCSMLNAMHIQANPVLINTSDKRSITDWLPSPYNFDHATVQVVLNNKTYWFDATIAYQRGPIDSISYPDYQTGLVITDTTTSLTKITYKQIGRVNVKEVFNMESINTPVQFIVITSSSGSFADDVRYQFKNNSDYEMQKEYKDYYSSYFDGINNDSLRFYDDEATGVVTTYEYYTIDSFWKVSKGVKKVSFEPFVLNGFLKQPDDKKRTMPFAITFPAKYHEEIEVNLPEKWKAKPSSYHVNSPVFSLSREYTYADKTILLTYDFENYKDCVLPEETSTFLTNMNALNEGLAYSLTYENHLSGSDSSDAKKTPLTNIVFAAIMILGFIVAMVWWSQRKR